MKLRAAFLALALAAMPIAATGPALADSNCQDSSDSVTGLPDDADAGTGLLARPSGAPKAIVVFLHGYTHEAVSWTEHMKAAADHGALAITPDYQEGTPNRGWHVSAGAEDAIKLANYFLGHCKDTIKSVIIFGVSMGGNSSGLAVASKPVRASGAPLFDYWFNIEGVSNVTETYLEASAVAAVGNEFAGFARDDIEAEMGGTLLEAPNEYLHRTIVTRGEDIKASGVKGVVLVHGVDDGLVPYNQSREMVTALRLNGVPAEMTTVLRRGSGESGTTLTGNVITDSPFAGHGTESSTTQLVLRIAHDRLLALLDSIGTANEAAPQDRETVVDDAATISVP